MPNSTPLELAAHQFAWFAVMCRKAREIVAGESPDSNAQIFLEMGESIGKMLAEKYEQMSESEVQNDLPNHSE